MRRDLTELERKYLNDEHEYCGEYGTDDCQFAYRIDKVKQERDFWEFEAKKYCAALGEQRIKLQQMECEMCKLEDTDKCRQC
jgi:putative hemolysin